MTHSLVQKTSWSALASGINLFSRLIVQVMIARILGPDGVGRIAYILWLIEISYVISCLGLPTSLTRYLAELYGREEDVQASCLTRWVFLRYLVLILIGSALVGILYFLSSQYADAESMLPVSVFLFVAYGLQAMNLAYLAGRQRFDLLARINVLAAVVLVMGVAVGAAFYGTTGALLGYLAGALVPAVYCFTMFRGFPLEEEIDVSLRQRVWKFSFNTWLAMLVSAFVWSRMEVFFIERYWNSQEVAMFTVALTFAMMVRQVATLFSGSFMAHFSQLVGGDNHDLIQRQYETATRLMAFVVVPMAFGGAAIMPVLLPLLFGAEFVSAVPNAMILTATSVLSFSAIGSALVYAKERSGFIALGGLAGAIMAVAAGFLVISRYGAWGAAWSQMFVQSSMIVLGAWFIGARLHFFYPFVPLLRTALAGTICAFCAFCIVLLVPQPIAALTLAITSGALVYIFSAKFLHVLGKEEVRQLKKVTSRLPVNIARYFDLTLDAMVADK